MDPEQSREYRKFRNMGDPRDYKKYRRMEYPKNSPRDYVNQSKSMAQQQNMMYYNQPSYNWQAV